MVCICCGRPATNGDRETRARLLMRAPDYWRGAGEWDDVRETFETYVARLELRAWTK